MVDIFLAYKNAIRGHYEGKIFDHISDLAQPTPAKLRDLCFEHFLEKKNDKFDDEIFKRFFDCDFDPSHLNGLRKKIDKFKPLCNFLKGNTELSDATTADMLALLIGYEHRPIRNFKKYYFKLKTTENEIETVTSETSTIKDDIENRIAQIELETTEYGTATIEDEIENDIATPQFETVNYENGAIEHMTENTTATSNAEPVTVKYAVDDNIKIGEFNNTVAESGTSPTSPPKTPTFSTIALKARPHKSIFIGLLLTSVLSLGYVAKERYFSKKECMQWQEDHYEMMDCEINGLATISPVLALDEDVVELKKVTLRRGMPFFKYNKPLYYYYKVNRDSVEFFNGPGLHPITQEPLRKITWHMIYKYVK